MNTLLVLVHDAHPGQFTIRRSCEYLPGGSQVTALVRPDGGVEVCRDTLDEHGLSARDVARYLHGIDLELALAGHSQPWRPGEPCRSCCGTGHGPLAHEGSGRIAAQWDDVLRRPVPLVEPCAVCGGTGGVRRDPRHLHEWWPEIQTAA